MPHNKQRRYEIIGLYLKGLTPTEIAEQLGVTRQRTSQVLRGEGFDPQSRAAEQSSRRAKERQQHQQLLEQQKQEELARLAAERPPCRICGGPVLRLPLATLTCSPECSDSWRNEGRLKDPEYYELHRVYQARSILRNPKNRPASSIAWAERILSGNPPPPNRRYSVKKSNIK